jgi:hypothetical protein
MNQRDYSRILRQRRYLDVKDAVEARAPRELADELRRAAKEHHGFEESLGHPDEDWAYWYALFLLGRITVPSDLAEAVPTKEELSND